MSMCALEEDGVGAVECFLGYMHDVFCAGFGAGAAHGIADQLWH